MLLILYVLMGLLVGAAVAYHYEPNPYPILNVPAAAILSVVLWPVAALACGSYLVNRAGKRARERKKELRDERRRMLAVGEAELNRDGFYGDEVKQHQLRYDRYNQGLYNHRLTGAVE